MVTHGNRDQKRGLGVGVGYPVADDKIHRKLAPFFNLIFVHLSLAFDLMTRRDLAQWLKMVRSY